MVPVLAAAVLTVLLLVYRKVRRVKAAEVYQGPLRGLDTGVRSPWRVPGRRKPHRGF